MKLIPNAGKVARRASSMWFIYGAGALQVVAEAAPHVLEMTVPGWVRVAAIVVTAGAGISRLVSQEGLRNGS